MSPWFILVILGGILTIVGIVALFILRTAEQHEFEAFGIKIKSTSQGAFILAIGAALTLYGLKEVTAKAGSHVTSVALITDTEQSSANYNVRCPMSVGLVGEVSLAGDATDVSYRLDMQNGVDGAITRGSVDVVSFESAGTKRIPIAVPVTIPEGTVSFLARLVTTDPTQAESDQVAISVTCDPNLPPGPPSPPPSITAPPP